MQKHFFFKQAEEDSKIRPVINIVLSGERLEMHLKIRSKTRTPETAAVQGLEFGEDGRGPNREIRETRIREGEDG